MRITTKDILYAVSTAFSVRPEIICSKSRAVQAVQAREAFMYIARNHTAYTFVHLAETLRGENASHNTAISAHQRAVSKIRSGEASDMMFQWKVHMAIRVLETKHARQMESING